MIRAGSPPRPSAPVVRSVREVIITPEIVVDVDIDVVVVPPNLIVVPTLIVIIIPTTLAVIPNEIISDETEVYVQFIELLNRRYEA